MISREELGIALMVAVVLLVCLAARWAFWSAREKRRRLSGHTPRRFALFGLGEKQHGMR